MNRGRFIGIASLPVLFLGAPNLATEVNAPARPAAPAEVRDPQWAERWKAAAAELAARKVARREAAAPRSAAKAVAPQRPTPAVAVAPTKVQPVSDDWAERWKAAKAELEARKAARREPGQRKGASPAVPATVARANAGSIEGVGPAAGQFERAQLLSMAQRRRPRIPK